MNTQLLNLFLCAGAWCIAMGLGKNEVASGIGAGLFLSSIAIFVTRQ